MTDKMGQCLCGSVRFTARDVPASFNACACDMCRRMTGSRFVSLWMPLDSVEMTGTDMIQTFESSDWASRAFCATCGSTLWYRPKGSDHVGLSLGLLDDVDEIAFGALYFSDSAICGTLAQAPGTAMTQAETIAHFTGRVAT